MTSIVAGPVGHGIAFTGRHAVAVRDPPTEPVALELAQIEVDAVRSAVVVSQQRWPDTRVDRAGWLRQSIVSLRVPLDSKKARVGQPALGTKPELRRRRNRNRLVTSHPQVEHAQRKILVPHRTHPL